MKWGALFPGQGSQYVGMGRALADHPAARAVFEEAEDALGYRLRDLLWEGPEARLVETEVQQPAILAVSVAAWRALGAPSAPASAVGLSLGEYSALVASGLLPLADAVRLTRLRGRLMQTAVPAGVGGMSAILGLDAEAVEALAREVCDQGGEWVEAANFNAPGQVVVSGTVGGLAALEQRAVAAGARAVRLPVSAPFHSKLLAPAEGPLAEALAEAHWAPRGSFPVIANVDGYPVTVADEAIPRLVAQVSHPVRLEMGLRRMVQDGAQTMVEFGPGHSMTALVKRIQRRIAVQPVESPDAFSAALELVKS
jgi:[acyl-carrier-protein] S-malonyltransferase